MVNGRLMRRYYYGYAAFASTSPATGPHMRNGLSASSLRPPRRRMGRAKRNPSRLLQIRHALVARDYGSMIRPCADNWLVAIQPFVARTSGAISGTA
jgi:hypothetical protein